MRTAEAPPGVSGTARLGRAGARGAGQAYLRRLGPGDVAVIPADVVHGTYNTGEVDARILAILSPPVGETGYSAVDHSSEEPWSTLRS